MSDEWDQTIRSVAYTSGTRLSSFGLIECNVEDNRHERSVDRESPICETIVRSNSNK